jgi:hypothetical protein
MAATGFCTLNNTILAIGDCDKIHKLEQEKKLNKLIGLE